MVLFSLPDMKGVPSDAVFDVMKILTQMDTPNNRTDKLVSQCYWRIKDMTMAKRKYVQETKKDDSRYVDPKEITWANIKATDEDVAVFTETEITAESIVADLLALIAEGYGISIKRRDSGASFQFTAICSDVSSPDYGHGFSAFADNPLDAISFALFKYFVIAGRSIHQYAGNGQNKRRLG